jgi:hypothetical protein
MLRTILALTLLATPALADTTCPKAVTDGVAKAFPKSKIDKCHSEHEGGKDIFEAKITRADGTKAEVDVSPDGTILQLEEKIDVEKLPDAVKKAFAAKYPKAKAERAEKQTAGKTVSYEVAFGKTEATFTEDGKFVEEE